jgi:CO/xanthine dehydrogenase FAD-binding subunit
MLTCDTYVTARSLDEAFDAMESHAGRFRLVAGATDLLPWAREGRAGDVHIDTLVDISAIPELRVLSADKGRIRIGAATPIQRFLDHPLLLRAMPGMAPCAIWFADDQIRESATIGGNLVNASPAADGIPPLLAHNAVLELAARRDGRIERRLVPLALFYKGPSKTVIEPDEILVAIDADDLSGYGGAFEKVGHRRSLVISVACVAGLVRLDPTRRTFDDVRLGIAGVGPVPSRLADVEALLRGARLERGVIEQAAAMPLHLVQSRTRRTYRREVLRGFVARALVEAARRAGGEVEALSADLEAACA